METLIACFKVRAVPVNINYRYTADELRYVYDNADLRVLVHHRCYSPTIDAVIGQTGITHRIAVDDDLADPAPVAADAVDYQKALETASAERDFEERSNDDLFIMYTGGTTGLPKGVMWRQEDIWRVLGGGIDFYTNEPLADEYQQSRIGAAGDPMRYFALPPLMHAAALMPSFLALWTGCTVIFEPKFDPHTVWRVVERHKAQVLILTGDAMGRPLIDAYRANPTDASSLIVIASGAALLSQTVKNELLELFPGRLISDSIGSSETGFGGMGFAEHGDQPGKGPRVQIGRGAIVVDDDGRPVAVGEEGWMAKAGNVPLGYYKDPIKTERLFRTVDGRRMVITDDRARLEEGGYITLLGRGNMVVNTGGEKVFVEEVEGVLKSHELVYDAIVFGVADQRWGHRVAAIVAGVNGDPIDFGAIEKHARKHLAGYKIPRSIWQVDAVRRAPSGKPDYGWAKSYAASRGPDHEI
jgi:fatty-acyl-CoA synthase